MMGLYMIVREYWELGRKGEDSWEWEYNHVYPLILRNIQVLGLALIDLKVHWELQNWFPNVVQSTMLIINISAVKIRLSEGSALREMNKGLEREIWNCDQYSHDGESSTVYA